MTIPPDLALEAGGRLVEACIGLAVPGRPIRSLVAENRSAEGVRDQTGPRTATLTRTKGTESLSRSSDRAWGDPQWLTLRSRTSQSPTRHGPSHKGNAAVVTVAGHPVLYGTFEPGWRWSEHLKPIAGTDSCQATHLLYCLSGRMRVEMSSGERGEIGPGDVAAIEPGHDAWVVGDEPCVAVDFGGYAQYAKG